MNTRSRRNFIKGSLFGAGVLLSPTLKGNGNEIFPAGALPKGADNPDEKYWEMVKAQFAIADGLLMVNAANLCPAPFVVQQRVAELTQQMQQDVSFQNRAKFQDLRKATLSQLADFLEVSTDEVGITRNTTEGNNIIVNGLELGHGDEVVLWDQNHQSNRESWEDKARRFGFKVKKISVPLHPEKEEDLISPFAEAISPNTKLISFSHISNVSGIALPAKTICQAAAEKGVLTLIDGAQTLGFMDLDLHDIGCDFYTSSTHKWLCGPFENGILYIKRSRIATLWPDRITVAWKKENASVDERFCKLGQRNDATASATLDAINFHLNIGKENVENRVRELNNHLKKQLQENIPNISFVTPISTHLSGGVTIIQIEGKNGRSIFDRLYAEYGIAAAPTGGIRLSPTICCTLNDMDRIVSSLSTLL